MKPGLHRGLSMAEYFAIDAVNASSLHEFSRSAMHAHYAMTHPEDTDALSLGHAVHVAILEPERFVEEYVESIKVDRRTTKGKAAWAKFIVDNEGKSYLNHADWIKCLGMRDAAWNHPLARAILSAKGPTEVSAVWERDGQKCKARVDKLAAWGDVTCVVDLKTTSRDAREFSFAAAVARYGYHVSAAWYLDGLATLAPMERRFLWVVIESDAPHGISIYEPTSGAIEQGRHEADKYFKMLVECRERGVWPGYQESVAPLSLPKYAMTVEEWEIQT